MRFVLAFMLLSSMAAFAQRKKQPKPYLDISKTTDSIFQSLVEKGVDTLLLYSFSRYPSELLPSTDYTNDLLCAYLMWETQDSSYLQKINRFTIYEAVPERKYQWYDGIIDLAIIFDYYRSEKSNIDNASLYNWKIDSTNYETNGSDTIYPISGKPNCTDCKGYFLKYKIGDTTGSFDWTEAYYHVHWDDNPLYFVRSEFFTWLMLIEKNIEHREKYRAWKGTKYQY
jgi:hypothetical protein